MKSLMNKIISGDCHYMPVKSRNLFRGIVAIILALAMLNLSPGCFYFKVTPKTAPVPTAMVAQQDDAGKTIVVHFGGQKWILKEIKLKNDTVSGRQAQYTFQPPMHPVMYGKPNRYLNRRAENQRYLLNEVHLYLSEYSVGTDGIMKFPASNIVKMDLYDRDVAATAGTWFLGTVGVLAGAYLILGLLVLIFKESCPFIYTWDGDQYRFAGEIYSGSIRKNLERHDYLKLPFYSGRDRYQLKITNEAREIQHTNLLELLVVDHQPGSEVLVDKSGKVLTLNQPVLPAKAVSLSGTDITRLLTAKDDQFYQSLPAEKDMPLRDGVIVDFPRPGGSQSAKIAIRAKNSILLDYMMGEFNNLFGKYYPVYVKKQQKSTPEKLMNWTLNQGIPLSLYVERNGAWDFVDYYNVAGPMAYKEDILQFPLKGDESSPLRVKLEFGNFFWEIDYAVADFTPETPVSTSIVQVETAVNETHNDVSGLLRGVDKQYYTQLSADNYAEVTFSLPQQNGQDRSVFLHSRGWYEFLADPHGKPDLASLKEFREPGRFNRFVNEKFLQLRQLAGKE